MAHDEIVKSLGRYGWYTLNDYFEMRNAILFGDKNKGYVPDIESLDGKTIDEALKLLDGDLIVSIRPTKFKKRYGRKIYDGWMLNILPMAGGYVKGTDFTMMNVVFETLDECIVRLEERKMKIFDTWFGTRSKLYLTGHIDAVQKAWDTLGFIDAIKMPLSRLCFN